MATKHKAIPKKGAPAPKDTVKKSAKSSPRARIRMYRVGLGDCFLLTFYVPKPTHVLIDCGMFAGSRLDTAVSEKKVQTDVAKSIAAETGGHIDVVVITHEHMDHVSIFNSAREIFDGITFGEVWVGWLEDPSNDLATQIRKKYEALQLALGAALAGLQRLALADPDAYEPLHRGVAQIAQFTGIEPDGAFTAFDGTGELGAAKKVAAQPRAAIDYVKGKVPKDKLRYGAPGNIWPIGDVTVSVLGPPSTEAQLRIMERAGATYDKAFMLGLDEPGASTEAMNPFAGQWGRLVSIDQGKLAISSVDGSPETIDILDRYNARDQAWRRIDNLMLESAATLALQMDKYINNTSLALAFEFPVTEGSDPAIKDVLLFPGDAQVGNWDSWSDIKTFSADDLLKRTIFYKVGHHGSHNATTIPALGKMIHPKLVAMIPTNEFFATNSKHWAMPAPNLNEALEERTAKRLLRNDQGVGKVPDPLDPKQEAKWEGLDANVNVGPLFIDYFV